MIKSMSGFGSSCVATDEYKINMEMKSVNSRYMDLNIRSPKIFNFAENDIRLFLKNRINRGRVDIFIQLENINFSSKNIQLDMDILTQRLEVLKELKKFDDISGDIDLKLISSFEDIFVYKNNDLDTQKILETLLKALDIATDELVKMRVNEGKLIGEDLVKKIEDIGIEFKSIEKLSKSQIESQEQKFRTRLSNLLEDIEVDEQRIAMELAIYADKVCIDEEIVRFESHILAFKRFIESDEQIGKKMDFLIQEMNREINTIASKSQDIEITNRCVNIKSILEMIREQVQNIE